jgi:hypothetical protein
MLSLPIGCKNFYFQNCLSPFWPGLMAGAEFWGRLFLDNQKCIGNEYIRASNNLWETLENSPKAKNGDKLIWQEKFSCSQGKAQACTRGAVLFFLLSLGEEDFFFIFPWFQMCSHYVAFKFPMGSHQVPNVFPNMFCISCHFDPIWFRRSAYVVLISPIQVGQREGTLYFKIEPSTLCSLHSFIFFWVIGQSNWLVAKKKKLNLRGHLI